MALLQLKRLTEKKWIVVERLERAEVPPKKAATVEAKTIAPAPRSSHLFYVRQSGDRLPERILPNWRSCSNLACSALARFVDRGTRS